MKDFVTEKKPKMRLADFIHANAEGIIAEWETFARSLDPGASMEIKELRDHAKQMLAVIAKDLATPQTKREGSDKSKGLSDSEDADPDTAAQSHGSERAAGGFQIGEMVSEYRALRASVIRLWTEENRELDAADVQDLVRFSEAIDQSLAESTSSFTGEIDRTKETFIGVLGHDLRTPLGAIITSAQFILEVGDLATAHKMAAVIVSSGIRMNQMVADLLDFTRSRLGDSIPIERKDLDLEEVLRDAVEESKAARPGIEMLLETRGTLRGEWDGARLRQVLSNLLSNAIDHASAGTPISLTAKGDADEVVFSVHNHGTPVPKKDLRKIFDALTRSTNEVKDSAHLGLGLYIVEQIVTAHGGHVGVESSQAKGTTFTVRLPRRAADGLPE